MVYLGKSIFKSHFDDGSLPFMLWFPGCVKGGETTSHHYHKDQIFWRELHMQDICWQSMISDGRRGAMSDPAIDLSSIHHMPYPCNHRLLPCWPFTVGAPITHFCDVDPPHPRPTVEPTPPGNNDDPPTNKTDRNRTLTSSSTIDSLAITRTGGSIPLPLRVA